MRRRARSAASSSSSSGRRQPPPPGSPGPPKTCGAPGSSEALATLKSSRGPSGAGCRPHQFFGEVRAQGKVTGGRVWAEDRFRDWSGEEGVLNAWGWRLRVGVGLPPLPAPSKLSRAAGATGGSVLLGGRPHPLRAGEKRGLGDVDLTAGFRVGGAGNGGRVGKASRAGREPGNRGPPRRVLIPLPSPLLQTRQPWRWKEE